MRKKKKKKKKKKTTGIDNMDRLSIKDPQMITGSN